MIAQIPSHKAIAAKSKEIHKEMKNGNASKLKTLESDLNKLIHTLFE